MKASIAAILIVVSLFLFVGLFPVHGEEEIYDSVVRLHILANSDSEEDQAIKLKVRDAILDVTAPLLENCKDKDEAETILRAHLSELTQTAKSVLETEGSTDAVTIEFDWEEYPERTYDSFCFPAGSYLSMRVLIGEAEGHNWWCCLFPPICRAAATVSKEEAEDTFISVGLTPSQYKIITENDKPVYKVRFKILEIFKRK
ncbi:MAG: stage II sporulation protein R [Ruminococcaceae bacterium]|nr:stage II sporulation protein R [Oscillospiraceae bacterium]